MVQKDYDWVTGAELGQHSRVKLTILRAYFRQYLMTRCHYPTRKFRLALIDGFCGAGRYKCGTAGSPLVFLETLRTTLEELNIERAANSLPLLEIQCLLIFNDADHKAIQILQENCAPEIAGIRSSHPNLHVEFRFFNQPFELALDEMLGIVEQGKFLNVLFNLDQCGHSKVHFESIPKMLAFRNSSEIFLTFAIKAFLTYLSSDTSHNSAILKRFGIQDDLDTILAEDLINKREYLGVAEQLVHHRLKSLARFVSPFSINNPNGWRYWLIHFANQPKARQVYNDTLHDHANSQAHFGHAGLHMLNYDPSKDATLYLFDDNGRTTAREQLYDDIPRFIEGYGDAVSARQFYEDAYRETAAHSEDVEKMVLENKDLEVLTPEGGTRRSRIQIDDIIRFKSQKSFFPMFGRPKQDM